MSEREILSYFFRKSDSTSKHIASYNQLSDYHIEAPAIITYSTIRLHKYTFESLSEFFLKLTHWRGIEIFGYKGKEMPEFALLPNLEFLSLIECNQLPELPQSLENLPALKYFFLVYSNVTSITSFIEKQGTLQKLTLEHLPKLEFLPNCFNKLIHLQSVTLKYLTVEQLPPSFGKLENLEELEITSCHNLTGFPDFSDLQNLKKVTLSFNKSLLAFPKSITQLTSLEELYIQLPEGAVFEIPAEIGNLKKLKKLTIYTYENYCKLTLPPETGYLTSLEECCVRRVSLRQLPESFSNCISLKELILSETQLEKLPDNIGNLTNLTLLEIDNNLLTTFPKSIGNLKHLTTLNAYGNPLTSLPEYFANCTALENLEIGLNTASTKQVCLSALPEGLGNLVNLKKLSLRGTFAKFPDSMHQLKELESFTIGGTENITTFPDFLLKSEGLHSINIAGTGITQVPTAIFKLKSLFWFYTENTPLQYAPRKTDYDFFRTFTPWDGVKMVRDELKQLCFHVYLRNYLQETFEHFSLPLLFKALCLTYEPLRNALLEDIHIFNSGQKTLKEIPLKKGDVVTVIGNISYKKNDIKEKLKQFEIGYSANFSDKTTHLLVGNSPKADFVSQKMLFLFNERELTDFLNQLDTPYLLSAESDVAASIENIRNLIYSSEDTNELLAVSMLEGVGLPAVLETEIFTLAKISAQDEVRTKARKLLQKYSKNTMLLNALSHRSALIPVYRGGKWSKKGQRGESRKVNYTLQHYQDKFPALDMATVSYFVGKKTGFDTSYFFMSVSKDDDNRRREIVAKQKENISTYLTLHIPFTKTELNEILETAAQKSPNLVTLTLNLERCNGFPENILKLTQMTILVLNDFTFEVLPSGITQLKSLEKLELRHYYSSLTLPENMGELKNLTSLLLRVKNITNLDVIRTQLPNCRITE